MNTCSICALPYLARGYCSSHYARWKRTGSARADEPIGGLTPDERFARATDRSGGPDACWPWIGPRNGQGYGRFNLAKATYFAHRYALLGVRADDRIVLHACDNPSCVNPAHLGLGSYLDNNRDRQEKGRGATWRVMRHSRLTPATAAEIRARYASGAESQQAIADDIGVSQTLVSLVIRGRVWLPAETGAQ